MGGSWEGLERSFVNNSAWAAALPSAPQVGLLRNNFGPAKRGAADWKSVLHKLEPPNTLTEGVDPNHCHFGFPRLNLHPQPRVRMEHLISNGIMSNMRWIVWEPLPTWNMDFSSWKLLEFYMILSTCVSFAIRIFRVVFRVFFRLEVKYYLCIVSRLIVSVILMTRV